MKYGLTVFFTLLLMWAGQCRAIDIIDYDQTSVPKNILKHIRPGVSMDYARETLGTPPFIYAEGPYTVWFYPFKDVDLSIGLREGSVFWLALISYNRADRFPVYPLYDSNSSVTINQTSLGEVAEMASEDIVFNGSRFVSYDIGTCYFGRPGHYLYYAFGAHIYSQNPEDDIDPKDEKAVKKLRINYVVISRSTDDPTGEGHENFALDYDLGALTRDGVYYRSE